MKGEGEGEGGLVGDRRGNQETPHCVSSDDVCLVEAGTILELKDKLIKLAPSVRLRDPSKGSKLYAAAPSRRARTWHPVRGNRDARP